MFICNWHWEQMQKTIPGIDRPPHATDFWTPSIRDSINLAILRLNDRERRIKIREHDQQIKEARSSEPLHSYYDKIKDGFFMRDYLNWRNERFEPGQLKQVLVLRAHRH